MVLFVTVTVCYIITVRLLGLNIQTCLNSLEAMTSVFLWQKVKMQSDVMLVTHFIGVVYCLLLPSHAGTISDSNKVRAYTARWLRWQTPVSCRPCRCYLVHV